MKNTSVNNNYKFFILFLCVCFCVCVFSIVFDAIREHQIYAASWTSQAVAPTTVDANGYTVIENEKHLAYLISNLKEDGKYRVGRNLNMSGYTWPGIGNATSSKTFKGIFDGGGFVISNITTETTWSSTGLFGNVSGATISNVSLSSCTIKGSSQVGTLVGNTEGATKIENIVLTNCQVEAIYYSTGKWVDIGGVVGIAHGTTTIENVYNNSGSVKSSVNSTNSHDIYMGGIVGHTKESVVVKNCINEVPVTNTTKIGTTKSLFAGGIVGYSYGVVSLCGNTGNVSAGNDSVAWSYAGGIVAYGQE
ncbi:MAG: hypothetical protein IJA69_02705, partial [Clostridia bacterium]|nr:hypothetical protein [Clostridia bacterium]